LQVGPEEEQETEEEREEKEKPAGDYWRSIIERVRQEESAKREEPTVEPPILDFSLDQPQQEEQKQVGRVSQEGAANCRTTHSRLFPGPATTRGAKPGRESQPRGRS
jgi:hypothetical protein